MKTTTVNLWSPLPPSPSGIADYVAEVLPLLARRFEVTAIVEDPASVEPALAAGVRVCAATSPPPADLDLYQIGNSPSHAFVYRAALARPGVVVLHEWSLHHLVLNETVERGDVPAYLREMRRAHGEAGSFVGRQVARALGGAILPALFPLNDRVLEQSLGVVALTRYVSERAARRLPGRPVLHLPHHLALPIDPLPTRAEARQSLALPPDALLVTAPGFATATKGLDVGLRAVSRLVPRYPSLRLVIAGDHDPALGLNALVHAAGLSGRVILTGRLALPDFVRHLCAADVVSSLRFPSHGEISGALVRALGVGRPVLVTAGTPASDEFPAGVVVPVDPGPAQEDELVALLDLLLSDPGLRERISALARAHVVEHHDLAHTVAALALFLDGVAARKPEILAALAADRAEEGTLLGFLMEEVRWGARDLGLPGAPLDLTPVLEGLLGGRA
ncbi:MAG TPA: glycosyltransferase family 4 protein [Vicinamibacteria bacterium]|nr:glycosyltransferase family 4 protein [Vicinamibacteria bacterium]